MPAVPRSVTQPLLDDFSPSVYGRPMDLPVMPPVQPMLAKSVKGVPDPTRFDGGLLFEPQDARSLAEQLLLLARDREQAAELGRRGAEGVRRHYTSARMAERSLEVFTSVIELRATLA